MVLSSNTAAMSRYAHLTEGQKKNVLKKARKTQTREEMYTLVADLANGTM